MTIRSKQPEKVCSGRSSCATKNSIERITSVKPSKIRVFHELMIFLHIFYARPSEVASKSIALFLFVLATIIRTKQLTL